MSLTDHLLSGKKPTHEQLVEGLALAERDIDLLKAELRERDRVLVFATGLLDATAHTLHVGHDGQLRTCVRGTCVELRRNRAQVKA